MAPQSYRRAVAECQPDFRLETLLPRQIPCPPRVAEIVRHRLLAQHVLAGVERRPCELEVCVARRADVDDVDVPAVEQSPRVRDRIRDLELACRVTCSIDLCIGDRDDRTARVATVAREVCPARPRARAQDADANNAAAAQAGSPLLATSSIAVTNVSISSSGV